MKFLAKLIRNVNLLFGYFSAIVIVIVSGILLFEVFVRYFYSMPTDWEIELSVMLLIISTFMAAGFTQITRGHVNIEILDALLSKKVIKWRILISDLISILFCGFISYSSWILFYESFKEGRMSESSWGPKLWPVFLFMAIGMTFLTLQIMMQILEESIPNVFSKKIKSEHKIQEPELTE